MTRSMSNAADYPLRATMCPTCPFRPNSKYAQLAGHLAESAVSEASRICHSTGRNGLMGRTGKPAHLCRGARDVQLAVMAELGVISAPTDEAWNDRRRVEMRMKPTIVKDPTTSAAECKGA